MDSVTLTKSTSYGSDSSEAVEAPLGVAMLVRPWAPAQRESSSRSGDDSLLPPGLLALIEDVLASRKATAVVMKELICVSGLRQANEALVAARQIQIALQGFRRRNPSSPVAVSIVIDAAQPAPSGGSASSGAAGPPHELVSLLRISRPAQILVTHGAFQQISLSSGLPLKPFAGRFGVHEYLWIGEDQLDLLQSEPQLTLAIVTPETPRASQIADQLPAPSREPSASPDTAAAQPAHLGRSTALSEQSVTSRWPGLLRSPRVWLVAGVPLLVVAIVAGVNISRSPSPPAPTPKAAPVSTVVPPPRPTQAPPDIPKNGPPIPANVRHEKNGVKPPAPSPARGRKPQTETIAQPAAPGGENCSDVPTLLKLAEASAENGELDDATDKLNHVLRCDPKNQEAQRELAKIQANPE